LIISRYKIIKKLKNLIISRYKNNPNKIKIRMPNIHQLCRKFILENLDQFVLELYEDKYQNQVMTLGIKVLTDEVNEENRFYELNYLTKAFQINLYKRWSQNNSQAWILRNSDTIYGYIAVIIHENEAKLEGLYLEPLVRGVGFAKKMLEKALEFCKEKNSHILRIEVASYNKNAIRFYEKNDFLYNKTIKENDDMLEILQYSYIL